MNGRGRTGRAATAATIAVAVTLGGCGIFKKGGNDKPKSTVLGERIPVLGVEASAAADPALAARPVTVPPPEPLPSWPQPGGNPQKMVGDVALAQQPARLWEQRIAVKGSGARLGAAPVIADGHLFVMDSTATVHALDATTGATLWETEIKGREGPALKRPGVEGLVLGKQRKTFKNALFGGGVSYDGGKLYATTGLGEVVELDAATGKIGWRVTPAGPLRGAPTIANGAVYVMTQDNQLYALNEADGSTLWTASGPLQTAGVFGAGAPAVARGTVIAGFSSGDLNAYRYENGRVVWQDTLTRTSVSTTVGDVTDIDASPVVDETRVYAVGAGGRAIALDLLTGQRLWELNVGGISTPALGGEWLFLVSDQAQLFCIEKVSGKIRWAAQLDRWRNAKKKKNAIFWTGPVLAGGRLVLANSAGDLAFVDPATGKVATTIEAGHKKPIVLPPVVAGGILYTLTSDGRLTAWR